jgi:hypothetical protein
LDCEQDTLCDSTRPLPEALSRRLPIRIHFDHFVSLLDLGAIMREPAQPSRKRGSKLNSIDRADDRSCFDAVADAVQRMLDSGERGIDETVTPVAPEFSRLPCERPRLAPFDNCAKLSAIRSLDCDVDVPARPKIRP